MVTGFTTMPDSNFFTERTWAACSSAVRFLWITPMPPCWAMAIAMAQQGGIGVIHKNLTAEEQAAQVRSVKKFESGMVVNPVTIHPDQTLADARALMATYRISGIPVVE